MTFLSIKDTNPDPQSSSEMPPFPFPLDSEELQRLLSLLNKPNQIVTLFKSR